MILPSRTSTMSKLSLLFCGLVGSCLASLNRASSSSRNLMVNGVDTEQGKFLFHTQVGCCSGALIAPDVVLAAAHEMPPMDVAIGMKVTVGAYYSDPTKNIDGDQHTVTKAFIHPKYSTINNDFSVMILDKPSEIEPIRINRDSEVPAAYENVTLLGTGTLNLTTSERSVVLQEAQVMYLPTDECRNSFDPKRGVSYGGNFLDDTNLCTTGTSDGCVFDSGGPVIVDEDDDPLLIALISFGVDCADPFYPAVNARVSSVHEWIDEIVCKYSTDPPKDFKCGKKTKSYEEPAPNTMAPSISPVVEALVEAPIEEPVEEEESSTTEEPVFSQGKFSFSIIFLGACLAAVVYFVRKNKSAMGTEGEKKLLLSKNGGNAV